MSEITTTATTPPVDPAGKSQGNPYVGPRTFTRDQAHLFFGRDREAEELFSRVVSQRLVLFYAQSGAGKSSLINTQLIPKLEEAGFVVLPVARVGGDLLGGVDDTVDNIYLFNLMLSLDQSQRDPTRLAHLTLPHFLDKLTTDDGSNWFYDETEEGGTRGQDDKMTRRAETPPTDTPLTIHNSPFTIHNSPPSSPNYVLIIDQFEEILTTHGDRWPNRADFFRQLEAAMVADPALWVVLTLREDFVAGLDPYAPLLSDNLRARYYMQRMGIDAAKAAISQPAAQVQRPFESAAVDLLVNNLCQVRVAGRAGTELGQYIEPVQLQVVCYQLWARLTTSGNNPGIFGDSGIISTPSILGPITIADVQTAGDVDSALATFYEETIAAALRDHPLAGGERRLRRWFEEGLITEAGTRGTVYQGESETAGLPNALVLALADRFLLRSESRAGGRWIELTHDRFVEPIVAANRAWEAKQNNPLTAVTRLWLENGRDPARLLHGQQLLDAQSYGQTQEHPLSAEEQAFLDACVQAEAEAARQAEMARLQETAVAQQRRTRNLWRVVTVVTLLALLALIATGWAWQQRGNAIASNQEAQTQANLAATAEAEAQRDRDVAVVAKALADAANAEAQSQAQVAAIAQATAEAARAETETLQQQIQADRMAQIALLTNIDKSLDQYPQSALLLAIEAAQMITPPIPSSLTTLRDLLARTGGTGLGSHESNVNSVAFSPDGQTLASGSEDGTIRLWSLADPAAEPVVLAGHESYVTSVAFSPDGGMLASGSDDETIRLWSLADPSAPPVVLAGHEYYVSSVAFSPDGAMLASGSGDGTIRLWSLTDPATEPVVLAGHEGIVNSVAFSPDGGMLASGSEDGTIWLWSLADPAAEPVVLAGHEGIVYSVAFSPDGTTLASGSRDNTIRLWSPADPAAEPVVLRGHEGIVYSVAFSPDGATLASGSDDETIRLWSLADPAAEPVVLAGHESYVTSVAFSPDGGTLASGSWDDTIRLWSPAAPAAEPVVLRGHERNLYSVAFNPDGGMLASGSWDGPIQLWSLTDPATEPVVLAGHEGGVLSVAFSPDGGTLASGSRDDTIRLWSLADLAAEPVVLAGHENDVWSVAFSQDGGMLASGSQDDTIRLWSLADPAAEPVVLAGHEYNVSSVAFSPDGAMLASGSGDGTIRLWSLADPAAELGVLASHESYVLSVAFSPDGRTLASGSRDNTIRLWTVRSADLLTLACKVAGRNLSVEEWQAAFGERTYRRTCIELPLYPSFRREAAGFARRGETTAAISVYQLMRELDPRLTFDPQQEANREFAKTVVISATQLARSGEITAAVATYQQALVLDPTLSITPMVEAGRLYAPTVVKQAAELAQSGAITQAVATYQDALVLDPTLPITPAVEAGRLYAAVVVDQAAELAQSGAITQAVAVYQQAFTLDPTLPITPAVEVVVEQATELAQSGAITQAVEAYQQALALDPTLPISPVEEANRQYAPSVVEQANRLAWSGEITASVAAYQEALRLDPSLPLTPTEEAGRQSSAVKDLNVGEVVSGTIPVSAGDWWRFAAKAGQTISISAIATEDAANMAITLYAPVFLELVDEDTRRGGSEVIAEITLPATGIYIIRVYDSNQRSGSYTLEVK